MPAFTVSFLDLLSCALGGILALWLLSVRHSQLRAASYASQMQSMQRQMTDALASLDRAKRAAAAAKADAEARQKTIESIKGAQAALIGLKGQMRGAVFIFDTSGSMAQTGRFDEYKGMLKGWILHLPFERFNVVRFSDHVQVWQAGRLVDATAANRHDACRFIDSFVSTGGTYTLAALQAAFALPNIDTITLMSDGRPEPGGVAEMAETHRYLARVNASRSVTINCVAMGDYFGKEYGEFLQKIAHDHGGMFIGR
jgi:Mg-chelatase subunit ChlD